MADFHDKKGWIFGAFWCGGGTLVIIWNGAILSPESFYSALPLTKDSGGDNNKYIKVITYHIAHASQPPQELKCNHLQDAFILKCNEILQTFTFLVS